MFEKKRIVLLGMGKKFDCMAEIICGKFTFKKNGSFLSRRRAEGRSYDDRLSYSMSYISQAFKKLCPAHHLYDLRHTCITRSAESGVNINVCQQLVGHSTPQLTKGIYTHVMDEFKRKEALKFSINPTYSNTP